MAVDHCRMPMLSVLAIPSETLSRIRARGVDEHERPVAPWRAEGGEPLRCCLRPASAGEDLALISYSPPTATGPWRETGPVFVHGEDCGGRDAGSGLPDGLRTGPRVLRPYRADGTLNYDAIRIVADGEDLEAPLTDLVMRPDVLEVHVRAVAAQCFTYAVRAG